MHVVGVSSRTTLPPVTLTPTFVDALDDTPVWWCDVLGNARGPHTTNEVLAMIVMGDVHARSRMWAEGMKGWERVGESTQLHWAYAAVVENAGADDVLFDAPAALYARAALCTDGRGYFPDPTMRSGFILLDDAAQEYLESAARRTLGKSMLGSSAPGSGTPNLGTTTRDAEARVSLPMLTIVIGVAASLSGIAWLLTQR